MTWSLNEIEAESRKAIHGAGLSWGLAEDGGKAVRWLAAHGVDPLPALSDVLDRHDRRANISSSITLTESGRWQAPAPICPIALGAALCDHADRLAKEAWIAGPIARPLLLVPFVAAVARILKRPLRLDVDGTSILLNEQGDPSGDLSAVAFPDTSDIRCAMIDSRMPMSPVNPASTHGIETDPESWARIASYVHRTYVPASERSRREGAGAGLIDND